MKSSISNARRRERGMTLAEALIAVLVFAVVFLAALMLYNTANRAYIATDSATVQQQNARFAMDRLVQTIENGGAFYNVTGSNTIPDEQIEDADQAVVFVRGDYNNSRETSLQNTAHPYVTVGNSEIVGYILRKPGGDANNTVNITMHFDTTTASPGRDATISGATISNEETVSVRAAAQDLADETNPPYQLTRVTFDDSGNPVYEVVADNIFRLSFDYTKKDGTALATTAMGGEDAQRADRALIRKINVNLISMSDRPDFRYTDSTVYSPVEGTTTKRYRKFALNEYVNAPNLGVKGSRHSPTPEIVIAAPPALTVCTGHDRNFYLSWAASPTAGISTYNVHIAGPTAALTYDRSAGGTSFQWKQEDSTIQNYTFSVWGISGEYIGTASPTVTKASTHESTSVPSFPSNMVATGVANLNEINVTWDPVNTSTSAITAATCTTNPGGAVSVPPASWGGSAPDLSEYHVYRKLLTPTNGVTGTFTVDNTAPPAGTRVDTYSISGFANTTPTSNDFTDHTAAPCGRYFYRTVAYDSGGNPTTLTSSSGSAAMSTPGYFIPTDTSIVPQKPSAPSPVGAVSPPSGSPAQWTITMGWPLVVRDSNGAPALATHYQLIRERQTGSSGWGPDSTRDYYETNQQPTPDVMNASQSYRYAVRAIYDCGAVGDSDRISADSDWYNLTCTFTPTVTATGTSIGNGTASNPWELDYPDSVDVSAPSGSTIQSVAFTLKEQATGIVIDAGTDTTAPFQYGYSNQQDGTIYRLEMLATSTAGCTYTGVYYIRDAPPVPACLLGTTVRTGPALTLIQTGSNCAAGTPGGAAGKKGTGKLGTATWTYTVPNSSATDALTLKQIKVDWSPDSAHSDATLTAITFPTSTSTIDLTTTSSNNAPTSTGLLNVPPTARIVSANTTTYQIKIKFTYASCDLDMTALPITKICLVYTSPATGTQLRTCNLVGAAVSGSNNPNGCD